MGTESRLMVIALTPDLPACSARRAAGAAVLTLSVWAKLPARRPRGLKLPILVALSV